MGIGCSLVCVPCLGWFGEFLWFSKRGSFVCCVRFVVVVLLLLLGNIFTVCRVTLMSSDGTHLRALTKGKGGSTHKILGRLRRPRGFLSAVRVNVALVNVMSNTFNNMTVTSSMTPLFTVVPKTRPCTGGLTVVAAMTIVACLSLVINRLMPGSVTLDGPRQCTAVLDPVVVLLAGVSCPFM